MKQKTNTNTDQEILIDLALETYNSFNSEHVKKLRIHLNKCQNRETCDGTPTEEVWYMVREILKNAESLIISIDVLKEAT